MYIVNDICYAGEMEKNIKVSDATFVAHKMLLVTFSSGERRLFDTSELEGKAFEPLEDDKILKDVAIFHGNMTWKNGEIDIAPETVYEMSIPYEEPAVM